MISKRGVSKNKVMNYIAVMLMIMCSGTVLFNIRFNSVFIPFFCLFTLFAGLKKQRLNIRHVEYPLIFVAIIIINTFFHIFDGVAFNGVIQIILYILGTYFLTRAITEDEFRNIYVDVVVFLTVIAIAVFMGVNIGFIGAHLETVNGANYQMAIAHVVGWGNTIFNTRMCGLFHEPGMFQIILNIALLFCVELVVKTEISKKIVWKIILLIIAILLTRSTSGYIVMCIVLGVLYIRIRPLIKKAIYQLFYYLFVPVAIYCGYRIMTSEVIINKLTTANISYNIRYNDFFSGIKMMFSNPVIGCGYNSRLYDIVSSNYGMEGISNGLFGTAIMLGIPAILIFVLLLCINIVRSHWSINSVVIVLFVLLEEMTESCFFFPVMLVFFFPFRQLTIKSGGKD